MDENRERGILVEEEVLTRCSDTPTKTEILKRFDVTLKFLDSGMFIRVGCREIAFSSVEEGMKALNAYVSDPNVETEIWSEKFNK